MKKKIITIVFFISFQINLSYAQDFHIKNYSVSSAKLDTVSQLLDFLTVLSNISTHSFMRPHCESIINVIKSRSLTPYEISFLEKMYTAFTDTTLQWNAGYITSYLERKRPFIISWQSPTDDVVSLAWMIPPKNWDIAKTYPLYVSLHGLYQPYSNPIEYMTRYLSPETILEKSFDDGYSIYPWGRGNLWYEGISETDVWESIEAMENLVKVDSARKYLVGHSMGGYGAWVIGQKSADYWAAIGVYAGALWYNGGMYLNRTAAQKLKDVPIYIVCGTQDGLLSNNQTAYNLLLDEGSTNVFFTTFPGGHESLLENWEGMYQWIKNYSNEKVTSIKLNKLPQFDLLRNYPNPFNPETTILYEVKNTGTVNLKVYDILGREIVTLVDEEQSAGSYKLKFNALSNGGDSLSGGLYISKIITGDYIGITKMILLK